MGVDSEYFAPERDERNLSQMQEACWLVWSIVPDGGGGDDADEVPGSEGGGRRRALSPA